MTPGLAGISHALFKDGTHPFKGPEPAARLANSPMPRHLARLQMAARVVHLSRVQAFIPVRLEEMDLTERISLLVKHLNIIKAKSLEHL